MARPIVTLTTDFGQSDYYVGAMKGVVLDVCPETEVIDLCHNIMAYDILDAAFTIAQNYRWFPLRTVHVVVVDPGVGTQRRPLLVSGDRHYFVGPDNGIFSFIYPEQEKLSVYHITGEHYFHQPVSNTFHARDVFASVAGWLAKGVEAQRFGDLIEDYVKLAVPKAQALNNGWLCAQQGVIPSTGQQNLGLEASPPMEVGVSSAPAGFCRLSFHAGRGVWESRRLPPLPLQFLWKIGECVRDS